MKRSREASIFVITDRFFVFVELPTVLFNLKRSVHVRSYKLRDLAVIQSVINTELLKVVVVSVFHSYTRKFSFVINGGY